MRRRVDRIRTGSGRALPAIALDAPEAGPTVVVTANVHGDEVTGLVACHRLDAILGEALRRGRVVLFPSLNAGGLENRKRIVPDDGSDLNRLFPGDARGSSAEQLAAVLWADLLRRSPDVLVDLHADSTTAIPYAIVDRAVRFDGARRRRLVGQLAALGEATGLTVLHEYPEDEYVRFGLDHSLAGAMVNHAGVPALTIESGPRRAVDPAAVGISVDAVLRVLHHLGLVDEAPPPDPSRREGRVWRRASAPRTHRSGVFVPRVAPGSRFARTDVLGVVVGLDGEVLEELRAPGSGIVISWAEGGWVEARGVTGTLGLVEG